MSRYSFFFLVRKMRSAQQTYYANRRSPDRDYVRKLLQEATALERRVDHEIEKGNAFIATHQDDPEILQAIQQDTSQ